MIEKDAFGGLAFGASARQLYVGGANLFYGDGLPAGRLYRSERRRRHLAAAHRLGRARARATAA